MRRAFAWSHWCVVMAVGVSSACYSPMREDAQKAAGAHDVFALYTRAQIFTEDAGRVTIATSDVGGDVRRAIVIQPSATVVFPPIGVTADAVLTFSTAVVPQESAGPRVPIEFVVFVHPENGTRKRVFAMSVDPLDRGERRWKRARVPLNMRGNHRVRLSFATWPVLDGAHADWAAWAIAEPQVQLTSQH